MSEIVLRAGKFKSAHLLSWDVFDQRWKVALDETITLCATLGRKSWKNWVMFLACCFVKGKKTLLIHFIGTSASPRSFKTKNARQLGFDRGTNKKELVTIYLFSKCWLKLFNTWIMSNYLNNGLIFVESCSVFGDHETMPTLSYVEFMILLLYISNQQSEATWSLYQRGVKNSLQNSSRGVCGVELQISKRMKYLKSICLF